jgi:hypothetical protein
MVKRDIHRDKGGLTMERGAFYIVEAKLDDIGWLLKLISRIPTRLVIYEHIPPKRRTSLYDGSYALAERLNVGLSVDDIGRTHMELIFKWGGKACKDYFSTALLTSLGSDKPRKWLFAFGYEISDKGKIKEGEIKITKLESEEPVMREGSLELSLVDLSFYFENLTKDASHALMKVEEIVARSGRKVSYEEWANEFRLKRRIYE